MKLYIGKMKETKYLGAKIKIKREREGERLWPHGQAAQPHHVSHHSILPPVPTKPWSWHCATCGLADKGWLHLGCVSMQQVKITYTLALDLTQRFMDLQYTELQCIIQHRAQSTIHYSTQSILLVVLRYGKKSAICRFLRVPGVAIISRFIGKVLYC